MDWETYNVEQDESQPTDTDVSFGDPTASDAEREADGKAKAEESRRRKKRRASPDSKESSEFSASPTVCSSDSFETLLLLLRFMFVFILLSYALIQDSLSDKKGENETPEGSPESVEVRTDSDTTLLLASSLLLWPFHVQATSPNNEERNEAADSKEASDSAASVAVSAGDNNNLPPT